PNINKMSILETAQNGGSLFKNTAKTMMAPTDEKWLSLSLSLKDWGKGKPINNNNNYILIDSGWRHQ
ncbi:MAG: hypothetical protein QWI73_06555, partial [Alphaproteobacteria bacterium]|nr:hypothetical protein [Alphaproteobacteria bacterium]